MATRMLQRRGTSAEWAAENPVLSDGEIGFERDTRVFKIGDGVTAWSDLIGASVDHSSDSDKLDGLDSEYFARQDRSLEPVPLRIERSGKDANFIFTVVEEFRVGGNRLSKSVLSGETAPKYDTRTLTEYALDGVTEIRVTVYTLTYDENDDLVSETIT